MKHTTLIITVFLTGLFIFTGVSANGEGKNRKELFIKIDAFHVRLIEAALPSFYKKGFKLKDYRLVTVEKAKKPYYRIGFIVKRKYKNVMVFGASKEHPSWEVIVNAQTMKIVFSRFPI